MYKTLRATRKFFGEHDVDLVKLWFSDAEHPEWITHVREATYAIRIVRVRTLFILLLRGGSSNSSTGLPRRNRHLIRAYHDDEFVKLVPKPTTCQFVQPRSLDQPTNAFPARRTSTSHDTGELPPFASSPALFLPSPKSTVDATTKSLENIAPLRPWPSVSPARKTTARWTLSAMRFWVSPQPASSFLYF